MLWPETFSNVKEQAQIQVTEYVAVKVQFTFIYSSFAVVVTPHAKPSFLPHIFNIHKTHVRQSQETNQKNFVTQHDMSCGLNENEKKHTNQMYILVFVLKINETRKLFK